TPVRAGGWLPGSCATTAGVGRCLVCDHRAPPLAAAPDSCATTSPGPLCCRIESKGIVALSATIQGGWGMPADEPDEEEPRTMLTFAQAAERLVTEEHVRSMGPEGLRKLARTDPEWPLGPGDYGSIAGARTLPYEVVVQYIKTRSK